ncbi:PQQ-dependent dehydrogenase, methanol/ethanol family [uncultured Cycloclasticus sp.]|uniref:PQQ-dependent dehydrogenase, methanol/ethanol family n=1 Tax=uncultured Cycloclasticus sp. TaxID=172194 RepID=UPI002585ED86|nr:PQQ-dependent dehydrogenase, methanol/ethanol family [uncultured Cycloclasticus sp.]
MNTIIKNLLFCFMLLILSACDEQNKTTNKEEELVPKSAIEQINRQINEVPEDVGVHYYGLEQNLQRYSPLTQINDGNVHQLKPSWVLSLGDNRGQQTQPLVINGVMYITSHNATYAVDARSGRQIWKSTIQYPAETLTCCGVTNRGATWYNDVLYRATPDNRLLALNPKNGKTIWEKRTAEIEFGYSMTSAPLVANNVVITGVAGGEFGARGFLDGWDPKTGEHLWRFHTIPKPGEKGSESWQGDEWEHGGGPTWLIGSYDKELDLVYWGVGNKSPWNMREEAKDNLYTQSMLAIRPKTGELIWHYQFTPNDGFDYDAVNDPILTEIEVDGKQRKVLIQANRNGFFYVLDRSTGKLLRANKFVDKVTWADGIDMETGRPIISERVKNMIKTGETTEIWPSAFGGKNLAPMSYSPTTGLAYANTFNIGWKYTPVEQPYKKGVFYIGARFEWAFPEGPKGYLRAIDPLTGKAKWQFPTAIPMNGGTLVTEGNLVFSGAQTGELYALNAQTGEKLWEFRTGSGIIAPPITYQLEGKQYIAIASGIGGVYNSLSNDINLKNINPGGSVWVFELGNGGDTSTVHAETIQPPKAPDAQAVSKKLKSWSSTVKKGAELYEQACSHCHGVEMKTSGTTFDLRTFPKNDKARFINSVINGKGSMPAWGNKLSKEEIEAIHEYVIN